MIAAGCGGGGCERFPQESKLFGFKIENGLDEDSFTLHPRKLNGFILSSIQVCRYNILSPKILAISSPFSLYNNPV